MSSLEAQMTERREWYELDGDTGLAWIPADEFTAASAAECYDGKLATCELVRGYGVRASAPGYPDCTPWVIYHAEPEALAAYQELGAELAGEDDEPDPCDLATREGSA